MCQDHFLKNKKRKNLCPEIKSTIRSKEEDVKELIKVIKCLIFGHDWAAIYYNPFTGEKDCGFICLRCHKVKIADWGQCLK